MSSNIQSKSKKEKEFDRQSQSNSDESEQFEEQINQDDQNNKYYSMNKLQSRNMATARRGRPVKTTKFKDQEALQIDQKRQNKLQLESKLQKHLIKNKNKKRDKSPTNIITRTEGDFQKNLDFIQQKFQNFKENKDISQYTQKYIAEYFIVLENILKEFIDFSSNPFKYFEESQKDINHDLSNIECQILKYRTQNQFEKNDIVESIKLNQFLAILQAYFSRFVCDSWFQEIHRIIIAFLIDVCENQRYQENETIQIIEISHEINKGMKAYHEFSADPYEKFLKEFQITRKKAIKKQQKLNDKARKEKNKIIKYQDYEISQEELQKRREKRFSNFEIKLFNWLNFLQDNFAVPVYEEDNNQGTFIEKNVIKQKIKHLKITK